MSNNDLQFNIIDALGKPCPTPLLMLKRALKSQTGQTYLLKSSDPHSQIDISRYCEIHQIHYQMKQVSDHEFHYIIES
ncbi:sulfurtransferase TusA family protein [Acinetobacter sp. NCu2D-2]|uniref:sulfurtransferase TusA family protein n=1 Tax=Acinetobacter sp. NCu2D-2 TaxID=1608473 RepID=UPI0009D76912